MLPVHSLLDHVVFGHVQCGMYNFSKPYVCHKINSYEDLYELEIDTQLCFSEEIVLLYVANLEISSKVMYCESGVTTHNLYIGGKRLRLKDAFAIIFDVAKNKVRVFSNESSFEDVEDTEILESYLGSNETCFVTSDIHALTSEDVWKQLVEEQDSFSKKFSCIEVTDINDFKKLCNTQSGAVHLGTTFLRLVGCFVRYDSDERRLYVCQSMYRGYGWVEIKVEIVIDAPVCVIARDCVMEYSKIGANLQSKILKDINIVDYIEGNKKLPGMVENPVYSSDLGKEWYRIILQDAKGQTYLDIYEEFVEAWIGNSENGLRKLDQLCYDKQVTVDDFVACLCNASTQVLQGINHWILRGFYSDDKRFSKIETKLLSSWTTDYDTAIGFARYNNRPFKHVFGTMLQQERILSHFMFCKFLSDGISGESEYEVIVVNEKCFSRNVALLTSPVNVMDMVEVGSGAEATVYASNESTQVLVYTEAQSKRDMLDMFIRHPHHNLPKVYKLSDNVYVMERLFELDRVLIDENELIRLSKTYQPIGTLSFKGVIDNDIFSAMNHLKNICGEKRYRVDFWGVNGELSNIMQRENGELVLVDPITTLKMTQEEWEAKR